MNTLVWVTENKEKTDNFWDIQVQLHMHSSKVSKASVSDPPLLNLSDQKGS